MKGFKIALIQLEVGANKDENLSRATHLIRTAAKQQAYMICLPSQYLNFENAESLMNDCRNIRKECFNSPYGTKYFANYAESIPGPSTNCLSSLAKELKVFIVGGSIPEKDGEKIFNTCTVWSPSGEMVAKFRKIQLVNINVPEKLHNCEADVLSPGNTLTTFQTPYCKVGLGICNDIRFQEIAQIYRQQECKLIVYPSCFNWTTGPVHWELLVRSSALNNQVYVAGINPAKGDGTYDIYGHSMVANPWGGVVAKCQEQEEVLFADIDFDYLEKVSLAFPLNKQRREDLYTIVEKGT